MRWREDLQGCPKVKKQLTPKQVQTMAKIPQEWGQLPRSIRYTNMTLNGLENLGLIEMRVKPGASTWECRIRKENHS